MARYGDDGVVAILGSSGSVDFLIGARPDIKTVLKFGVNQGDQHEISLDFDVIDALAKRIEAILPINAA